MSSAKQQPAGGQYDENVVKHLRKFTSAHEELLNWVVFQALQLKRVPANVRQQALIVELDYHPNAPDSLHRYANPVVLMGISQFAYTIYSWFSFTIKGTHVVPRTYVTGADANVAADIQRRDDRCRRNGGIGAAVVSIQCGGLSQVMPVEVDPPSQITWDSRDDWSEVARHFVNSGRTDFKPISTSSRGLVSLPFVLRGVLLLTLLPELSTDEPHTHIDRSSAGHPNRTPSASIITHLIHHGSPLVQGRSH